MAKLENKPAKAVSKSKAKKRKHAADNEEMEVANKSLIVEAVKEETDNVTNLQSGQKIKALKRKNTEKGNIKQKRSKRTDQLEEADNGNDQNGLHQVDGSGNELEGDEDDEETNKPPTSEEMQECEKLETSLASRTIRQKKKQKHQQRLETQKEQIIDKEKQRNEDYLRRWKNNRSEWKFEKLRQISIQQSVFDDQKIDDVTFAIAVEYLSGSKGAAKDKITKLAEEIIDKLDTECTESQSEHDRQAIVNSIKYQRARELLQSFE